MNYLVSEYPINIRQACKSLNLEKSSYYYQPQRKEDAELIVCLNELSEKHPSYGFKKMFHSLRNQGFGWNHKKVYRVYKKLGLNLTRKRRRNSQYMHYYYYFKMIRSLSFTQRKGVFIRRLSYNCSKK
ncbi:IS3 family transposase [uncultured Chryseobacterium sp.]|uniref:IS3 family transposase n=1 Tax=uncultured Chryseobacterium sp. TaxID=259322 RepID=UPI00345B38DC